eukprot:s2873_g3.t1
MWCNGKGQSDRLSGQAHSSHRVPFEPQSSLTSCFPSFRRKSQGSWEVLELPLWIDDCVELYMAQDCNMFLQWCGLTTPSIVNSHETIHAISPTTCSQNGTASGVWTHLWLQHLPVRFFGAIMPTTPARSRAHGVIEYRDFTPRSLSSSGVQVLPVLGELRRRLRCELREACRDLPEFKPGARRLALGSFGALGTPSSFHLPVLRECRLRCMASAISLFGSHLAEKVSDVAENCPPRLSNRRLEMLWDRLCIRHRGDKITGETTHRDVARFKLPEDDIFGGWLNLDAQSQYFHCVPGSHRDAKCSKVGFCREPSKPSSMRRVEVPAGHLVIFFQEILHEVPRQSCKCATSVRLFVGWRLTRSTLSLQDLAAKKKPGVPTTATLVATQGVPLLPSGQQPPMYARNHFSFWRKGLIAWSEQSIRESCLELKDCGAGERWLVPRFLTSLQELGLPLYAKYTEEETSILKPAEEWTIFGKRFRLWPEFDFVPLRPPDSCGEARGVGC